MRIWFYDTMSVGFSVIATYFFYQCVVFLAKGDYIAGILVLSIGAFLLRNSIEFGKLGILVSQEKGKQ